MHKLKKQFLSFVLALTLAAGMVGSSGATAYAANPDMGLSASDEETTAAVSSAEEEELNTMAASTDWYGDGTATAYSISTADELIGLANLVSEGTDDFSGKAITLTADIDLSGEDYSEFVGIGTSTYAFAGTFDGGGHTVTLAINSTDAAGLFAYVTGATIRNVTTAGSVTSTATGTSTTSKVGTAGLVGYVNKSTVIIQNCENQANITGMGSVGGLIGHTATSTVSMISGCSNTGDITSTNGTSLTSYAGGIAGILYTPADISYCTNSGTVSGSGYLGGILGYAIQLKGLTITDCLNKGTVECTGSNVGGILGQITTTNTAVSVVIQRCGNEGDITGTLAVGGIAGYCKSSKNTECVLDNLYNTGTVTGTYAKTASGIGGIIGYYYVVTDITNVYNVGSVKNTGSLSTVVGGICGWSYTAYTIENAYSAGTVSYSAGAGGGVFVGYRSMGTLTFSNLYYLEDLGTTLIAYGAGSQTATALSSDSLKNLQTQETNLGIAFVTNTKGDSYHSGYPVLAWELLETTYQVNESLSHITSDGTAQIRETYDYEATLTADDGYVVPDSITVTVNGTALGSGDYTYTVADGSATAALTIPASSITGTITITAAAVKTYTVTSVLKNVTSDGASSVADGSDYTATLTAAAGYDLPDSITVTVGDGDDAEELAAGTDYTYNNTTGVITIYANSITGDLTITAKSLATYTVTKVQTNLTITGDDTATEDTDYEATLAANEGYALPDTITVTVGDGEDAVELAADTGYNYDATSGELTVLAASVTGNLTITASAVQLYTVAPTLTNLSSSNEAVTVRAGNAYETTLTADTGYIVPDEITVTVDGVTLTAGTDYTYTAAEDSASATLVIPASSITGTVVITAAAIKTYGVTLDLLNLTSDNTGTFVRENVTYETTLTANAGYVVPDELTVKVTVGEETTTLTAGTDYTYEVAADSASAELVIPAASITGDLTITALAADKYDVTAALENLTSDGESYAVAGRTYTATLSPANGYALPEYITVTIGGIDRSAEYYNYDSTTGDVEIPGEYVTGAVTITASAVKLYTVTMNLTNLSSDEAVSDSVRDGKDYETTLTADDGYILPTSITVAVGTSTLEAGTGYTYEVSEDSSTAALTIPSTYINADITVTAEAVKIYTVTATLENVTGSNEAAYIVAGSAYETTLTADTGYILPDEITVTVGGEALASDTYTYNVAEDAGSASLAIAAEKITGNIEITVTAVRLYNIEVTLTSLTSNNDATTILAGEDYTATFTPEEGYNFASSVTVTVGGTALTAGTDYTYDASTGTLTIPTASITGDIVITAVAACGEKHQYDAGVVTEATCIHGGYTTYTCSECGASYTDSETEALGHDYQESAHEDATCTEDGYTTSVCSRCGAVSKTVIAATGHDYVETVVEPTCTTRGYTIHECQSCGNIYYTDLKSPTGHDWELTQVLAEATCTADGSATYTCSVCGETKTDVIEATGHSYVEDTAKRVEATCTENGSITYTCSVCGDSYTETIEAAGHSYVETIVEPTCTEQGYTKYECSVCGDVYYMDTTPAAGHDYEITAQTEADCTHAGTVTYTCKTCGDSYTEETADAATGHTYVEDTDERVEPTCTTDGSATYTCSSCGDTYTETLEAVGHSYVETVIAATCTDGGKTEHKCSVCGNIYYTDLTSATGHTWDAGVVTTEPTCTTEGVMTYTCSVCKETYTEAIAATGHSYVETVIAATCTDGGKTEHKCSVCGNIYYTNLTSATGHTWDAGAVTTEPTCTTEGVMTYTCSVCEEMYTEVIPATGHSYVKTVIAATCTDGGKTEHKCSVCGNIYYTDLTSATGHTYVEDTEKRVEPTCTTAGSAAYTCSSCGDSYTETLAATGHSYTETVIAATCTEGGKTEHKCSVCGNIYYTDVTSATGHSYVEDTEKRVEPTCTTTGSATWICSVCGDSYTETLAATGHSYAETVIAATCTEGGRTEHKCSICGDVYYTDLTSATGHTYVEDTAKRVAATCTEDGSVTYICTECGDSFTDTIAATGHSWDAGVVTKEATATEEGEITYTCTLCGETRTETIEAIATVGDTVVLRSGNTFSFWYTLGSGEPDLVLTYGRAGDDVFIGDWDGDGIDTICVRRGNTFYFKNDFSSGDADYVITYGREGDEVLVGDWNGDGKDTLAVRRNGNVYYFKYSIESGDADEVITYGRTADEVLVGDWNGDGKDTLAVRRNGTTYYFKYSIENGDADEVITYGRASDEVLVGDWDGDEKDTLCVRRGNVYYFKNTIVSGDADEVHIYGDETDESYAGRWRL